MSELLASPNPNWLIAGVIPARSLTVIYGPPGAGKTFVAMNMAMSISAGMYWLDHKIQSGPVIYCTPEGLSGLKQRVLAWQTHHKAAPDGFGYIIEAPQLAEPTEVDGLISSIKAAHPRPAAVFIDTLARHMPGADENSAQHMGAFVAGIDKLRHALDCAVVVIHHTGKNSKNERGSTALRGAADTMIAVTSNSQNLIISCDKQKDAEPFKKISARLLPIELDSGASSCICALANAVHHSDQAIDEKKQKIILALQSAGDKGLRVAQCLELTGLAEATYHRHQKALLDSELIEPHDQGYRLSEQGKVTALTLTQFSSCSHESAQSLSSLPTPFRGGSGDSSSVEEAV